MSARARLRPTARFQLAFLGGWVYRDSRCGILPELTSYQPCRSKSSSHVQTAYTALVNWLREDYNDTHFSYLLSENSHLLNRNRQFTGKRRIDWSYRVPVQRSEAHMHHIHFSFYLSSEEKSGCGMLYETFHGGNISIQYLINADVTRGYLHKPLSATLELIVEHDDARLTQAPVAPELVNFFITQDTQKHELLPELSSGRFQVTGNISTQCSLSEPISGDLIVEASAVPIQSIDILLLCVESILAGERIISDTSVIQTTQIADGDVCRSMTLPIYVILPRLLVCPTVLSGPFSIEFQVSIVISFKSGLSKLYPKSDLRAPRPWLASLTLPLRVFRT
ncbi:hypothetical protein KSP39_PZI024263 [Platanthera zijinensis]|uniref:Uncharacterized protein n=1 Tax=Platanthera zijinensis TaxID=2320716 RepID=A0AAP0FU26_9ASPA